ncbi:MAG: response regulator transcription factor [Solirubrobacteraceae bacterium]
MEVHQGATGGGAPAIRLVVADDDPAIRLTLAAREEGLEVVGEAQDADEAIELVRARP